ncbi:MAG TPA: hypothetical protein VMO17_01190 [Terriglobia bacterium]|nr:hypothetical protein [Terriglobia bacterium]
MAVGKQSNKLRKPDAVPGQARAGGAGAAAAGTRLPAELEVSTQSSLAGLAAGDILFLDDFPPLREEFPATFVAVMACPLCGMPGLITAAQYSGVAPIVCTSRVCPGQFRIVDEVQIAFLPPC